MEFKHFSHNHQLGFHQMPQGTEVQCSGCQYPAFGSVYVCWQCNFFLHDQCFRASRSLKHPSHPLHPLTLVPYPTYPSNSFYCNSCNLIGNGFCYCCSECEFDLHLPCAYLPNSSPPESYPPVSYPNQTTPIQNQPHEHFHQNPYQNYSFPNATPNYNPQPTTPPLLQTPNPHPIPNNPVSAPVYPPPNGAVPVVLTPAPAPSPAPAPVQPQTPPPAPAAASAPILIPAPASAPVQPAQPVQIPNRLKPQEIKHFSHPHGLRLSEIDTKDAKKCSGCEDVLDSPAYCCVESQCNFYLHKSCFELPQEIRHKSHLDHPLTLLASPAYQDGFTCNACIQQGGAFVYNCSICSFDLHVECVSWPETVKREDHQHPLTLYYSNPVLKEGEQQEVMFQCDVCQKPVHQMAWIYSCRECDFGTHLECVATQVSPPQKSEEEVLRETMLKMEVLNLLLNGGNVEFVLKN